MSDQLPDTIKPQSLVDTGGRLNGFISLDKMARLSAQLASNDGFVEAQLSFGKDVQGIRLVRGTIKTELQLTCQRCLEVVSYPLDLKLSLALIASAEQAEDLPEEYEPLVLDSPALSLTTLIEDELLLALPIVAMHPETTCSINKEVAAENETVEKPHPFATLAQLKGKLD